MKPADLRNRLEMFAKALALHQQQLCTFGQQPFAVRVRALAEEFRIIAGEVKALLAETETVACVGAGPDAPAIVLPAAAAPKTTRKRGADQL